MKALKLTYQILSGLSLVVVLGVILVFGYSAITSTNGGEKTLSPKELVFVLNHGNIVTEQNYEVIYSYQSGSSFNGDHLDYYCIQLESFEFQTPRENEWVFGTETNEIYTKVRDRVAQEGNSNECFPNNANVNSEEVAAKIWSLDIRRDYIEGALVILFHKPSKRLLYVSTQT